MEWVIALGLILLIAFFPFKNLLNRTKAFIGNANNVNKYKSDTKKHNHSNHGCCH